MRLIRAPKGTATIPNTGFGNRFPVILDNRQRTARLWITIAAVLTVAGAPAGLVRNGGRLSAVMQHAVNENGEDTYGIADAYMLRALAEFVAAQPLAGTTLPASAALPIGVYPLRETYPLDFAPVSRLIDPAETYFMEADPSSFFQLDSIVIPNAINTLVAPAGGSTVTIGNVTVTVWQEFASGAAGTLPIFKPRVRQVAQSVAGTNPADVLYLKTAARLRSLTIAAEAIAADGGRLIVSNAISALRLIGDARDANVIGPNQATFGDLVESQREIAGGDTSALGAFFTSYFADNGRLGNTIVPAVQFPNFRYELSDALSGGLSTRVVVLMEELVRKGPVNGYQTVQPELPSWLA